MNGRLIERERLTAVQRDAMRTLLGRHFAGVDAEVFEADLANKSHVILLSDPEAGDLVGFSTLGYEAVEHEGESLNVVVSGDTIVDPAAWGNAALSRTWIASVRRLHADRGVGRLIWLLITSGYRTYRFLPVFWREFWPRFDRATPADVKRLMDALASRRYGDAYDAERGVVRFDRPQVLRGHLAGVPESRRDDPHVAFFERANPGHALGDELVSVTQIAEGNLTAAGGRMVWGKDAATRTFGRGGLRSGLEVTT